MNKEFKTIVIHHADKPDEYIYLEKPVKAETVKITDRMEQVILSDEDLKKIHSTIHEERVKWQKDTI